MSSHKSSRKKATQEFFRGLHKNRYFRVFVYTLFVVGLPVFGWYAYFIEPKWLNVTRRRIKLPDLPDDFHLKIVHISDLHFGPANSNEQYFRRVVKNINALEPDLVAITGDSMQWSDDYAKPLAKILADIQAKLGTFVSLGNHDYGVCHPGGPATDPVNHEKVIAAFESQGQKVLHNQAINKTINGHLVRVIGLGDYWTHHFKPNETLFKKSGTSFTLLLSHNPDSIDALKNFSFDLMLSGHVHGGQISLPWIGPLVVPVKYRHLRRGLHHVFSRLVFVTRGIGYTFRARSFSRPEIALLEIVS